MKDLFVYLPSEKLIGKIIETNDEKCSIEIFFSISNLRVVTIPKSYEYNKIEGNIKRAVLTKGMRVFVFHENKYQRGRLINFGKQEDVRSLSKRTIPYEVMLHSSKIIEINERFIYVRPMRSPQEDPVEILKSLGSEAQCFYDRREKFLNTIRENINSNEGMTAISSAGIDLIPHQLTCIKRILNDPIQRYLLADEVGLGKTIEAGIIIRQQFIDNPNLNALILAPKHLCPQWHDELHVKIKLWQFGYKYHVESHESFYNFKQTPDILVVDETHLFINNENDEYEKSFERLKQIASSVKVLLLLSATPPIANLKRFHSILNLLDPNIYQLDEFDRFKDKFDQSKQIGRYLLQLNPQGSPLTLKNVSKTLQEKYSSDTFIADLTTKIIELDRNNSNFLSEVENYCFELKQHIADNYRIHQRIIRSRRKDVENQANTDGSKLFCDRGRVDDQGNKIFNHVIQETTNLEIVDNIIKKIDEWRQNALDFCYQNEDCWLEIISRYKELLYHISIPTNEFCNWQKNQTEIFEYENELLSSLSSLVSKIPYEQLLETAVSSAINVIKQLSKKIKKSRIVVFSSSSLAAKNFKLALTKIHEDPHSIFSFMSYSDPMTISEACDKFKNYNGPSVLIMDRSGEVGFNFSYVDGIIHLDFPIDIERIEQRIGRLDRIGRKKGFVINRVLSLGSFDKKYDDINPWNFWFGIVRNGFEIFHNSMSSIQFKVNDMQNNILKEMIKNGPIYTDEITDNIKKLIKDEINSQDEQYALDKIALENNQYSDLIQNLEQSEKREKEISKNYDQWYRKGLQLRRRIVTRENDDILRFKICPSDETLIPYFPWVKEIEKKIETDFTYNRSYSQQNYGVSLMRPGNPFSDLIERFTLWDDRGSNFITHRKIPGWKLDEWIGLKITVICTPSIKFKDFLKPSIEEVVTMRRSLRYFKVLSRNYIFNINGEIEDREEIINFVKFGYKSGELIEDTNLSTRPEKLFNYINENDFKNAITNISNRAISLVYNDEEKNALSKSGILKAEKDLFRLNRHIKLNKYLESSDFAREQSVQEQLIQSLKNPDIKIDSIGLVILDNELN